MVLENIPLFLKQIFTNKDLNFIRILLFLILTLILSSGINNIELFKKNTKLGKITAILISLIAIIGLSDKTIALILTSYSAITIFIFLVIPILVVLYFIFTYKDNTIIGSFVKTLTYGFSTILLNHLYKLLEYYNPTFLNSNIDLFSVKDIIDIILLVFLILFFYYLFDFITKLLFKKQEKNTKL